MRSIRKLLVCTLMILSIVCSSVAVNANNSTLWVSAGGTTDTSTTDYSKIVGSNHSYCHIRLKYFHFTGYVENVMPKKPDNSSHFIHARLYSCNTTTLEMLSPAMDTAHFTQSSSYGYDYSYYSGYGTVGAKYRLRTNSSYTGSMYEARFYWYA